VRVKRNLPEINRWMHFRGTITPEMQTAWFHSVNNIFNSYFVISYENQKVGLIHLKNQDFNNRKCEGGMLIWDQEHRGTGLSVLCSVMMTDFAFYVMKFRTIYAKVLRENRATQSYNRALGYTTATQRPSDGEIEWLQLDRPVYAQKISRVREAIGTVTGDATPLSVANISFADDSEEEISKLYLRLPEDVLAPMRPAIENRGGRPVPVRRAAERI